jgi:hypothetical protein
VTVEDVGSVNHRQPRHRKVVLDYDGAASEPSDVLFPDVRVDMPPLLDSVAVVSVYSRLSGGRGAASAGIFVTVDLRVPTVPRFGGRSRSEQDGMRTSSTGV